MTREEKIEFILEVTPNLAKIIKCATDEQIDFQYQVANEKVNKAIDTYYSNEFSIV